MLYDAPLFVRGFQPLADKLPSFPVIEALNWLTLSTAESIHLCFLLQLVQKTFQDDYFWEDISQ